MGRGRWRELVHWRALIPSQCGEDDNLARGLDQCHRMSLRTRWARAVVSHIGRHGWQAIGGLYINILYSTAAALFSKIFLSSLPFLSFPFLSDCPWLGWVPPLIINSLTLVTNTGRTLGPYRQEKRNPLQCSSRVRWKDRRILWERRRLPRRNWGLRHARSSKFLRQYWPCLCLARSPDTSVFVSLSVIKRASKWNRRSIARRHDWNSCSTDQSISCMPFVLFLLWNSKAC